MEIIERAIAANAPQLPFNFWGPDECGLEMDSCSLDRAAYIGMPPRVTGIEVKMFGQPSSILLSFEHQSIGGGMHQFTSILRWNVEWLFNGRMSSADIDALEHQYGIRPRIVDRPIEPAITLNGVLSYREH